MLLRKALETKETAGPVHTRKREVKDLSRVPYNRQRRGPGACSKSSGNRSRAAILWHWPGRPGCRHATLRRTDDDRISRAVGVNGLGAWHALRRRISIGNLCLTFLWRLPSRNLKEFTSVNGQTAQISIYTLRHNGPEHVLCYALPRSGKGVGPVVVCHVTATLLG